MRSYSTRFAKKQWQQQESLGATELGIRMLPALPAVLMPSTGFTGGVVKDPPKNGKKMVSHFFSFLPRPLGKLDPIWRTRIFFHQTGEIFTSEAKAKRKNLSLQQLTVRFASAWKQWVGFIALFLERHHSYQLYGYIIHIDAAIYIYTLSFKKIASFYRNDWRWIGDDGFKKWVVIYMSSDSSGWKVAYMLLGAVIFVVSLFYLVAWLSWQRCESQHWWLLVIVERRHLFHQNKHGIHKCMHWERDILWKYTVYIYIYICIMTTPCFSHVAC